ncbi:MAG: hypothetical protein SH848_12815 [Saprospiraceae bacterium]|nr:hypothetical protein [Saprospiraceae bacterium]MDZ4704809.1 hypothetical protein [Saprospiraceae bacterium]
MSSSISLASNLNTAIHVDGSGQKTEASLVNNKVAKFTFSSSDIQLSEETSVPSGTTTVLNGSDYQWTVSYRPSNHTAWIFGSTDVDMGLTIKVLTIDMDDNDFYLQKDGSGNIVLTVV